MVIFQSLAVSFYFEQLVAAFRRARKRSRRPRGATSRCVSRKCVRVCDVLLKTTDVCADTRTRTVRASRIPAQANDAICDLESLGVSVRDLDQLNAEQVV